ncbi:NAD(P)-dependent oxidoreductase [Paenibacillus alba]|uniref:NAD-dependent epimerase/dehydratase family protein n=1 Tax=Paenibacillus alba TaxID=1197127 RepID=UPI0015673560|nr:NAD(P)-dependent oxidoreductase [Paenibacillus alba]NQX67603.1 NAD(P)-dependent oxidoreductase [Paenibacillus alba]
MRIFVAGSTGVVGKLLLPKLIVEGHEVIGMTHKEENKAMIENLGAKAVIADAFDRASLFSAMEEARPDVVIHQLTSLSTRNFSDNSRIRIDGTRNIVDAAQSVGVKQLIAQSIAWAYESGEGAAAEDIPLDLNAAEPRQGTVAGVSALEKTVAEMPNHVILRYGMFYGQGTWYDLHGFMAEEVRQKRVKGTDAICSFLHVEDAANTVVLALNWPSGPINIVDDEPAAGKDWLPVYAQAVGAPLPELQSGSSAWERGALNGKARKEYGWKPSYPTWRTGFAQSLSTR